MKIRVATYNIHKGVSSVRGLPRVHALKQAIALFHADGFCKVSQWLPLRLPFTPDQGVQAYLSGTEAGDEFVGADGAVALIAAGGVVPVAHACPARGM